MLSSITTSAKTRKSKSSRPPQGNATLGLGPTPNLKALASEQVISPQHFEVAPRATLEYTPDTEAEQIGELFFQIGRVFRDVRPKGLKSLADNLTMAQGRCLWAITKQENCTLRELSQHLGVSPSTASELVDPLVRAELVQRETDLKDRRVVRLRLAKKGHAHFVKHKKQRNAHFRVFLDHLTREQRQTMLSALETLNEAIQQVEENEKGKD